MDFIFSFRLIIILRNSASCELEEFIAPPNHPLNPKKRRDSTHSQTDDFDNPSSNTTPGRGDLNAI